MDITEKIKNTSNFIKWLESYKKKAINDILSKIYQLMEECKTDRIQLEETDLNMSPIKITVKEIHLNEDNILELIDSDGNFFCYLILLRFEDLIKIVGNILFI